jgi:HEAT repeat protein
MNLPEIQASLDSDDSQARMRAITALREWDTEIAVPLLIGRRKDPEFMVRSFVAMALGRKRNELAFEVLLQLMEDDADPNVRAEAASAIGLYGTAAIDPLVAAFAQDQHWLVRRSILAAVEYLDQPVSFFRLAEQSLDDTDLTIRETGIECLASFAGGELQIAALDKLLPLIESPEWRVRLAVARVLRRFDSHQARTALSVLQGDSDHRVLGAVLEGLV